MRQNLRTLWNNVISAENFSLAVTRALRAKRPTPAIHRFIANREFATNALREHVSRGEFRTGRYVSKIVHEPKRRQILILPFYPDRIVHHALMNVISPIWDAQFISDSYACRVGRGIHAASRRIMGFIRHNRFYLQCDISKFYPNIDHNIMYGLVCKSLHAGTQKSPLLDILHNIIYSIPGDRGMPIGNLTSQWLGNLYMNELDRYVKDTLRVRHYARYCDDFVLFSNDKSQLRMWRDEIREFLIKRLGLRFSYAEIAPVSNGLDFCGYRHFPGRILPRRRTYLRLQRRARRISHMSVAERMASPHVMGQIASMSGWLKHCHSTIKIPEIINKKGDKK